MSTELAGFEVIRLWPSTFLRQALPDYQEPTNRLAELVEDCPPEGVFAIDDASVEWLKAHVAHGVGAYLQKAGFPRLPQWRAHGVFDVQRFAEYRSLRNRPGAYLAGMYVVQSPSERDQIGVRDDRRPGCVTFYDPRTGINMNAISRDPYVMYHHTFKLTPGLLLMWPAYVDYFMHPNLSREPAVQVAFDLQVQYPPQGE